MATRMQQRRGTAAQWTSTNSGNGPVLNAGEIGFEIDNNRFKIGDGVNHWVDLPYFANNEAITDLIDGAPALLDTLNELAAAVGDDPAFFTTVATNLSNHQSDTTNIHGIADTALLATKAYADQAALTAVDNIVAGAPALLNTLDELAAAMGDDPAYLGTIADNLSALNTDFNAHSLDTTNVHGIADVAALATQSYADDVVSNHNQTTINVHGIADTAQLATKSYADTAVSTHNADTTSVHGISDTTALATKAYADDAVSDHNAVTTNVHGISDTSALATQTDVDDKIDAYNLITTNVHGIADTEQLATQDFVADAITESTVNQSALAGLGLSWDGDNEQFLVNQQIIASKDYTALLLTQSTQNNISITGDADGLVISAENGVSDSTTTDLAEGTNLYFTNERAQDAVGNAVGDGLTYTDSTGEIKVNTTVIQARVANVTDTEIGYLDGVTSGIQSQIDAKLASSTAASTYAPIESPTFTGTVSGVNKAMVGLGNVDNTTDANKPVSTATQTALDAKAPLASPDLTGVPTAPTATAGTNTTQIATTAFVSGAVSDLVASAPGALNTLNELAVALGNDQNFSTTITNSIATKAPIASPTFTGTVSGVTKAMVGLGNVDNTSDVDKPVSTANQTALDLKANLAGPTFTGTVSGITKSMVGLSNVDNTSDENKPVSSATQTALDLKAPLANPTFTGTVSGITKSMVGLANVDNTTDANKPISTATQSALDLKADKAGPTFTGTTTTDNLIVDGDFTVNGTNFSASATSITIEDNLVQLAHQNASNTVDLGLVVGYNDGTAKHSGIVRDVSADKWKLFKGVTTEPSTTVDFTQGSLDDLEVAGFTASSATIGDVSNTELQYLNGVTSAVQTQIDSKAPTANPTFTGTVAGVTKTHVGLNNVDNTSDASKPISTATQSALDLKAPLESPTFTGSVTLPSGTVTSGMIANETIVNEDISASAAIAQSKISGLTSDLDLKAPLASPALTGTPTAPTASAGTNTTQVATTAFVGTAVANLVASAPATLDTLNELATALGNDASFSTTVTNSIATKAPINNPTFTGTVQVPTLTLTNPLSAANGGTGLSSLGTGVATFLGTPSSANLAAMITDEIGTGNIVLSEVSTNAQTASYTLVAADRGKLVEMNVATANTLTVPTHANVPFPLGTQIDLLQVGSGKTTIQGAAGVTVNATPGLAIRAQWGGGTLIKRGDNLWVLIGDLTTA
jgi:hypothetical protein